MHHPDHTILDALTVAHLHLGDAAALLDVPRAELEAFLRSGTRGELLARTARDRLREDLRARAYAAAIKALNEDDLKARLRALDLVDRWLQAGEPDAVTQAAPTVNITVHPPRPRGP